MFLLINACIGLSSAPFYVPEVKCSRYEPTDECSYLQTLTSVMYGIEIIGSLLLIVHSLIGIALVDNIKHMRLIKFLRKFTKIVLLMYIILIIMRVGVYIKVQHEVAIIDNTEEDQGFGNFLAGFVKNSAGAVVVTCLLMSMFVLCCLMNVFALRVSNSLERFVLEPLAGEG